MASVRIQRLSNLIKARVATLLIRDAKDPRLSLVTITKVDLAKDLTSCKVFWSSLSEGGKRSATEHALEDATPFLQREVARILDTRITPRLFFAFDPTLEGMERVSTLINQARNEDREAAINRGEDPDAENETDPSVAPPPEDDPERAG